MVDFNPKFIHDDKHVDEVVSSILDDYAKKVAVHSVRKLSNDEVWIRLALDCYENAEKDPRDGTGLHRKTACEMAGLLNKCTDDGLYQLAQPGMIVGKMDNPRSVLIRLARIMLKKRGMQVAQGW